MKKISLNIFIYIAISFVISVIGLYAINKFTPIKYVSELHFELNIADPNLDYVKENFPVTTYDSPAKFIVNLDSIIRYDEFIDGKKNICQDMQKKYNLMPIQFVVENEIIFSDVRSISMNLAVECSELIKRKIQEYNSYVIKRYSENYILNETVREASQVQPFEILNEIEPRIKVLLENIRVKLLEQDQYDSLETNARIKILENYIQAKTILFNLNNPSGRLNNNTTKIKNLEILKKINLIKLKHQNLKTQVPIENYKMFLAIFSFSILSIYIVRTFFSKRNNIKNLYKNIFN